MNKETVARWSKAILAVSAAIGIGIEPEHIDAIVSGGLGIYGVITAIETRIRKGRKDAAGT